ncbi:MAG: hypothetical protein JJE46_13475 [Acidimicrobiia bacterium]|nr:hypothetical protein [Acidimicrobiia bacterium]
MRFTVDPWDPSYGSALETVLDPSEVVVNADVEVASDRWTPIAAEPDLAAATVLFVDGVRRIDARVWVEDDDGGVEPGVCATYAAGVVRTGERAEVVAASVGRGVFSASRAIRPIPTRFPAVTYLPYAAGDSTPESLWLAIQDQMGRREIEMADVARRDAPADALVVVDGPITNRAQVGGAVGVIKTHATAYLPPDLHRFVGGLPEGSRTPVFTIGGRGSRHSWYLRLPGGRGAPWSGVVRCECSSELVVAEAVALANRVGATVPRFASESHKDPRAPQNLYPIGGLERELRRRLGDAELLYRALAVASAVG